MIETIYGYSIPLDVVNSNINRLTNQLWKLIPMRENNEDWNLQLNTVIIEINGLHVIFAKQIDFLILLSKLEGIKNTETEFNIYRKAVFEAISLLRRCKYE